MQQNPALHIPCEKITGLILAGGAGTRMQGQDKGLLELGGKTLVQVQIEALKPFVQEILISANRHLEKYAQLGCAVVPDIVPGFAGPLTGLASLLQQTSKEYAICLPCDTPLLPSSLIPALWQTLQQQNLDYVYVRCRDKEQPLLACMRTSVRDSLETYLQSGNDRVFAWVKTLRSIAINIEVQNWELQNINATEQLINVTSALAMLKR